MADANHYSIAKPNEGITGTAGTEPDRPSLRGALGNVHPVRDLVKSVSVAVKKALGKDDDADASGGNALAAPAT